MIAHYARTLPATFVCGAVLVIVTTAWPAVAAEPQYEAGVRGIALFGNGEPANDILGGGVFVNRSLRDRWYAGLALERYSFDFERVASVVGVTQDPSESDIDAKATNRVLSAFLGRRYGRTGRGFQLFWTAGLGVNFPNVDDAGGPTASGGTFDVTTDAGTELHLLGSGGVRYAFSPRWSVDVAARLEHHFMDYQVRDRVSGNTREIDSQSPWGVHFGFACGFGRQRAARYGFAPSHLLR